MSYKDNLKRLKITIDGQSRELIAASFRGVPFYFESYEMKSGRRLQTSVFYNSNLPINEDLGAIPRAFTFNAYLVGRDPSKNKNDLIAVLEQPGPGLLLHPYFGEILVNSADFSLSESKEEIGLISFNLSFIAADFFNNKKDLETSAALELQTANDAINLTINKQLSAALEIRDLAEDFTAEIENSLNLGLTAISSARESARSIAKFNDRINGIKQDLSLSLLKAEDTAASFIDLIGFNPATAKTALDLTHSAGILAANNTPGQRLKELLKLTNPELIAPSKELPESEYRAKLADFVLKQSQAAAGLNYAAETAAETDFNNFTEVENLRKEFREITDRLLINASDEFYRELIFLLAALDQVLILKQINLKPYDVLKKIDISPALSFIYSETGGTIKNYDNFILENNIINPLFIPPGEYLINRE